MASTGNCEVYCYISNFTNITGEASHYMEVHLQTVPQKDGHSKIFHDAEIVKPFVNGYASISMIIGSVVRIKIPTTGFEKSFTVPDSATFNLSNLI